MVTLWVVRGPAGLEAGFVTKLFIIQLKLKVQTNAKGISKTKGSPSICDAKYPVTSLRLGILNLVSCFYILKE